MINGTIVGNDGSSTGQINSLVGHYRGAEYLLAKQASPEHYLNLSTALEELADFAKEHPETWNIYHNLVIQLGEAERDDKLAFLISRVTEMTK